MRSIELPTTAGQLGALFGAQVIGDADAPIAKLSSLEKSGAGTLTFLASPKFQPQVRGLSGSVIFTRAELTRENLPVTYLVVKNPQESFAEVARTMLPALSNTGISPQAVISPEASVDPTASIGPFCIIEAGAKIGARTIIYPYTYVGREVQIGEDCEIHPRCTFWNRVRIGNRVRIFTGATIGSEGFGYFREPGEMAYSEMPQIGTVVIEDDCRIGVNCCVDRATLMETRMCEGVKLDNMVQVGHNVLIGKHSILCAHVGIGGSSHIEEDVVFGGQSGIGHGVHVGSGARLGGQVGSTTNVPGNETYFLTPATPTKEVAKIWRYFRKLPELARRVKRLEERFKDDG